MTSDQLMMFIRRSPFQPFTIRTAGGRDIEVTHPEAIAYGGGRTVAVVLPDDRFEILDLLHVKGLHGASPADAGGEG
jgi:hypothetical protein